MQGHEDVSYRVSNLKQAIFEHWTRITPLDDTFQPSTHLMHPDRLSELRASVVIQPTRSESRLCDLGDEVAQRDRTRKQLHLESEKMKKGYNEKKRPVEGGAGLNLKKVPTGGKRTAARETILEMQAVLKESLARLEKLEMEGMDAAGEAGVAMDVDFKSFPVGPALTRVGSRLLHGSPIAPVRIGPSTSTKLNHIIEQVSLYWDFMLYIH